MPSDGQAEGCSLIASAASRVSRVESQVRTVDATFGTLRRTDCSGAFRLLSRRMAQAPF